MQLTAQAFELEKYELMAPVADATFDEEERKERRLEIDIGEANDSRLDVSAQDLSLLNAAGGPMLASPASALKREFEYTEMIGGAHSDGGSDDENGGPQNSQNMLKQRSFSLISPCKCPPKINYYFLPLLCAAFEAANYGYDVIWNVVFVDRT